jgi:hypothetical protein
MLQLKCSVTATLAPIPRDAPVTSAVLPSRGVEETVVSEEAPPEDGNSVLSIIRILYEAARIVLATSVFSRHCLTTFPERLRARTVSYRASTARYPRMVHRIPKNMPERDGHRDCVEKHEVEHLKRLLCDEFLSHRFLQERFKGVMIGAD